MTIKEERLPLIGYSELQTINVFPQVCGQNTETNYQHRIKQLNDLLKSDTINDWVMTNRALSRVRSIH